MGTSQIVVPDFGPDTLARLARDVPHPLHLVATGESTILYIDAGRTRYVSAERWHLPPGELAAFMDANGGDAYNWSSPAAFALDLWGQFWAPPYVLPFPRDFRARFCRGALYGGRAEVYRYGDWHLHTYDINSSYGYAATTIRFPVPTTLEYIRPGTMRNILKLEGASQVVFSQAGGFPVLPLRVQGDNAIGSRVIYAITDHQRGIYTHTELRYAVERGVVIHAVEKQYVAAETYDENPFAGFVAYCYERRTQHKVWKRIMNALFGRLAVTGAEPLYRYTPGERPGPGQHGLWLGLPVVGQAWAPPPRSNPLWAAMVLGAARVRLHQLLTKDCYYCDTDAVKTCRPQELRCSGALGGLKHDAGRHVIARQKGYAAEGADGAWDVRLSGIAASWRTLRDVYAARATAERAPGADGWTRPLEVDTQIDKRAQARL